MVKMKGMGELENLSYKEMRGTYFYETFHSKACSATRASTNHRPQSSSRFGGMNRGTTRANHGPLHRRKRGDVRGVR